MNLAGTIRDIKDVEYYVQINELSKHFKTSCGSPTGGSYFSWVPYNILTNGTIIHDLTGEIFNQPLFSPDYTVDKDHVDVISYYGNMMEKDGRLNGVKKGTKACGMCLIPNSVEKTTVVRLRGVCKYSEFDKEYQVTVAEDGDIVYYGLKKTTISYNYTMLAWQIIDVIDTKITASFESGFESMALGTNTWEITNDLLCQKGTISSSLSLSACSDNQFTCGDGLCIDLEGRCDGVADCKDLTHEIYMALIYLMRPWTSTNAENFQTSSVSYIFKIARKDPIQHICVKSVYSTPLY